MQVRPKTGQSFAALRLDLAHRQHPIRIGNDPIPNMILTAAFVEGVALFAVIAGILAMFV